jgi:hypothetical protein
MEKEKMFEKINDHTYRLVKPPGIKISWDFDYTVTGESNGLFDLVLDPRPGSITVQIDEGTLIRLRDADKRYFAEKNAVRFSDIVKARSNSPKSP